MEEFKYYIKNSEVIPLVSQLLMTAIQQRASDIHIEPYDNFSRIRLRIDGLLHEIIQINLVLCQRIVTRLKILANCDIAEHRQPQDGHINFNHDKKIYDLRFNSMATIYGEKVVIRIQNNNIDQINLDEIGLEPQQKQCLRNALKKQNGIIIITGPTGSGKTLTLYALLKELQCPEKNICTIEDPVEIKMPGINQMTINHQIQLDFSQVLRALLRQDPDILLIGEIRDCETASIALKAAQTGHLILSTLHTNNAEDSIKRLLHLGVTEYQLLDAIEIIVAQRLVRKLCCHCKIPDDNHNLAEKDTIIYTHNYKGCQYCLNGYLGRIAIFECCNFRTIIDMGNALQQQKLPLVNDINLKLSMLKKINLGLTSVNELHRVLEHNET